MEWQKYVRPAMTIVVALIGIKIASSLFTYFTYRAEPEVTVVGIAQGGNYKGKLACHLSSDNGYKVSSIQVMLNEKTLFVDGASSIRSKQFKLPFEIETNSLSDGKHVLKVASVDASYHANKRVEQVEFFVDNKPLKAALLQPDYAVRQGRTFHPKIQTNKSIELAAITLLSKQYNCYPDSHGSAVYESFIPVDCEQHPGEYLFTSEVKDSVGNVVKLSGTLQVKKVTFPHQKGFHISPEKLNDEREISMKNSILQEALEKWLEKSPKKKLWSGAFEVPTVVQRISTPYGEIRITPERGRYLHRAIDIVNRPKSVVWASQNGRVIIKDRYLMSGNTVVIDHGLGVMTKYFHLDDFAEIEVGDFIRKGEPVGKVGMTGYAHGYHLHWEVSINGVSVDPLEWTKKVF